MSPLAHRAVGATSRRSRLFDIRCAAPGVSLPRRDRPSLRCTPDPPSHARRDCGGAPPPAIQPVPRLLGAPPRRDRGRGRQPASSPRGAPRRGRRAGRDGGHRVRRAPDATRADVDAHRPIGRHSHHGRERADARRHSGARLQGCGRACGRCPGTIAARLEIARAPPTRMRVRLRRSPRPKEKKGEPP